MHPYSTGLLQPHPQVRPPPDKHLVQISGGTPKRPAFTLPLSASSTHTYKGDNDAE